MSNAPQENRYPVPQQPYKPAPRNIPAPGSTVQMNGFMPIPQGYGQSPQPLPVSFTNQSVNSVFPEVAQGAEELPTPPPVNAAPQTPMSQQVAPAGVNADPAGQIIQQMISERGPEGPSFYSPGRFNRPVGTHQGNTNSNLLNQISLGQLGGFMAAPHRLANQVNRSFEGMADGFRNYNDRVERETARRRQDRFQRDQLDSRERMFNTLAAAAGINPVNWHVYLFDDPDMVDVRAIRGNYIFVWSGVYSPGRKSFF